MSGAVSVVSSGAHKILFEPSEHLWQVWGLILMQFCPSYHLYGVFPFPLDTRFFFFFFFGGMQHSLVDGCSAASFNFGVLAGEDVCTSFYSTISIA